MSFLSFVPIIGQLFASVGESIDRNVTSDEERLIQKSKLAAQQAAILDSIFSMQEKYLTAQQTVLTAELQHGNWLAKSWRPITMMCFLAFVLWFGVGTAFEIPVPSESFVNSMMGLIKIGMGGYILGRSGEKIAVNVVCGNLGPYPCLGFLVVDFEC